MRARLPILAVLGWASGCMLFPSLDGLIGDGGAQIDAPLDSKTDVNPSDGGKDGPVGDAPVDVQASPFCAQHPGATFCADFDESSDPAAGFTSTYLTDGGVVSRDTTAYATSPASLLAGDTTLASGADSHGAVVETTAITPQTSATLDLDLRVDALATQGSYIEALALVFQAATRSSVQLNLKSASSELGEEIVGLDGGKTYVGHTFANKLAMGSWMHLQIALALKSPRTITVTVDQTLVLDHVPMNASFTDGPVELYVGNAYAPGPSDGASLHYDDVLLVLQ